jgi:cell division protein FtsB
VVLFSGQETNRSPLVWFGRGRQEKPKSVSRRNTFKADRNFAASWRKKLLVLAVVLVAGYLLVSFIFGEMGLMKYYRMKAQYTALNEEIAVLKRDNAKLRKHVHALKNDTAYVERIARDKLGLARPGEIVYYYGEP